MQSLLKFFRSASPLTQNTHPAEKVKSVKPPAVKARLEARNKTVHNAQNTAKKQERAAAKRSEIMNKLYKRLQQHKSHVNEVRQRKAANSTYSALKQVRADQKLFAAISRRSNALQLRQTKAQRHN
jgi:acyl-CoA reductase-like NAD-dependent aldehyde dehydrogenase